MKAFDSFIDAVRNYLQSNESWKNEVGLFKFSDMIFKVFGWVAIVVVLKVAGIKLEETSLTIAGSILSILIALTVSTQLSFISFEFIKYKSNIKYAICLVLFYAALVVCNWFVLDYISYVTDSIVKSSVLEDGNFNRLKEADTKIENERRDRLILENKLSTMEVEITALRRELAQANAAALYRNRPQVRPNRPAQNRTRER